MHEIIITDYDKTLANPKSPPSDNMLYILNKILETKKIAILTGGRSIKELKELLITDIHLENPKLLKNLYLCPRYGNSILNWDNDWHLLYQSPKVSRRQMRKIEKAINKIDWKKHLGSDFCEHKIQDKETIISISCLGNFSDAQEREMWDKDGNIRRGIKNELSESLERDFEIYVTGRNTIDIVPKGMNKADNILRLLELTTESLKDVVYIGDEFKPDGNDYPILSLDIKVHKVNSVEETESILKDYI